MVASIQGAAAAILVREAVVPLGLQMLVMVRCVQLHAPNILTVRQYRNPSAKVRAAIRQPEPQGQGRRRWQPAADGSARGYTQFQTHAKAFQDVVKNLKASGIQADFPLCEGFAVSSTSVYTNHFAIKLDYYYSIRPGMGQVLLYRKYRPLSNDRSTDVQLSEWLYNCFL
jgi:hypothetical protein